MREFLGTLPHRPVVALDIDGTLGEYHAWFEQFASLYTGKMLVAQWPDEYKGEFSKALGLPKRTYREAKLAFRQGGMKRSMPAWPNAVQLVNGIRRQGAEAWFCTTRPFLRLDNIDPDTREWFRRNGIKYNGLLYGDSKYKDLVKIVGKDRIVCVLDDLPEQVQAAHALGLPTLLRRGDHNRWFEEAPGSEVQNLYEAEADIIRLIKKWKDARK